MTTPHRQKALSKTIQTFVQNWHNDACRYKHAYVTDDVDGSFALYVIIQNVYKRNQVDPKRLNAFHVNDEGLNLTVDSEKRVKDKTNQNGKIDVHQKKESLSFPDNLLLLYPYRPSDEEPQHGKNYFSGQQRYLDQVPYLHNPDLLRSLQTGILPLLPLSASSRKFIALCSYDIPAQAILLRLQGDL